jgi:hypothetical protein
VTRDPLALAARRLVEALDAEAAMWMQTFPVVLSGLQRAPGYAKWLASLEKQERARAAVERALAHRRRGK